MKTDDKKMFSNLVIADIKSSLSGHLLALSKRYLRIADVMSTNVATTRPEETVASAARVMSERNISCIIVMDEKKTAGIFTETDILKRVVIENKDVETTKVSEIMTRPVVSIPSGLSILKASRIMSEEHIKRLPVIDTEKLVGVVTQTDLVRELTSYGMWRDVSDIMNGNVAEIHRGASVAEAAEIMARKSISCIVIRDGEQVAGVLTERDLLKKVVVQQINPAELKVEEVMSSPVVSIPPGYSVFSASRSMEEMHIRRLVVMDDNRLRGIVTQTDIFQAIKKKLLIDEEKLTDLLDSSGNGIYIIDLEGRTTYVNPALAKLLEVSEPQELVNHPFLPAKFWCKPKERKRVLTELKKGSVEIEELSLKTAKGKKIYVTLFSACTRNIHGEINGSQGVLYNVTAQKELVSLRKAEEALRESEQRYRAIFEQAADSIMLIEPESGALVEFNDRTHENLGYSRDEFNKLTISDLEVVESGEKVAEHAAKIIREGADTFEAKHRTKDDRIRDIQVSANAISIGSKKFIQAICRDVTERKKAEEQLKKAKEEAEKAWQQAEKVNKDLEEQTARANELAAQAEESSTYKSEFLANMSHEIRTPLNAIMGFSDILLADKPNAEQAEYIQIIHNSSEHLLELINDILDFTRIEAGKIGIEIAECSLKKLLGKLESMIRPEAIEKGLEFDIKTQSNLPSHIHTDAMRMNQCLTNLVGNAVKFTAEGHVFVNVSLIEKDHKPYVRFDVEDTGIGIPPEEHENIFTSFAEAEGSIMRKFSGTGLGLAITKQLAEKLGGEFAFTSEIGKGSVFTLTIPVNIELESKPLIETHNTEESQVNFVKESVIKKTKFSGRVLVAEDVVTNQLFIKRLLTRIGLQATIVEDGQKAVEAIEDSSFDLILMDIQMPNMSGYEAVKVLREKGCKLPIVALTAYAMKGDDEKCFAAGCDDYMSKPINLKDLITVLEKHLPSENKMISESIDTAIV